MKHLAILALCYAVVAVQPLCAQEADVMVDGKKMFSQKVTEQRNNDIVEKTVQFFDANNKLATKDYIKYNAKNFELLEGRQENYYTGAVETVKKVGNQEYQLSFIEAKGSKEKTESLTEKGTALKGSLVSDFIVHNLKSFLAEKEFSIRMLVPSRMESIGFDLEMVRSENVKGKDCAVIKMRPTSWFIRQLVDDLFFWVTKEQPARILKYQGRLTPTDPKGKVLEGTVEYK